MEIFENNDTTVDMLSLRLQLQLKEVLLHWLKAKKDIVQLHQATGKTVQLSHK